MIAAIQKAIPRAVPIAILLGLAIHMTRCASEIAADKEVARVVRASQQREQRADSLKAVADSLARQRDSLAIVAAEKQKVVTKRIEVIRTIAVPDTCKPLVAQYDSVVNEQQDIIGNLNWALRDSRTVEQKLREANRILDERGDSLQAFILRPKKKPSRLALAVFGGQCVGQNGTGPCIGVGLSWRIF